MVRETRPSGRRRVVQLNRFSKQLGVNSCSTHTDRESLFSGRGMYKSPRCRTDVERGQAAELQPLAFRLCKPARTTLCTA